MIWKSKTRKEFYTAKHFRIIRDLITICSIDFFYWGICTSIYLQYFFFIEVFASKAAAVMDDHADSAILHVCGGNAVNVFLGIGVAWAIAAIYHTAQGNQFHVEPGGLAFSVWLKFFKFFFNFILKKWFFFQVTLFCAGALIAIILLQYRRYEKNIQAELGGPTFSKIWTGTFFIFLWIAYIIISGLQAYCIIPTF